MGGERMPQVVQPNPSAPRRRIDSGSAYEQLEDTRDSRVVAALSARADEERVVRPGNRGCIHARSEVLAQLLRKARRERHPAGFEEFCLGDKQRAAIEVD